VGPAAPSYACCLDSPGVDTAACCGAVSLPVLLAVDADLDVLQTLETQLAQRYGRDYRVECLGAPDDALDTLTELANAGAEVALVLAGLSGSDASDARFFEQVRQLHPHAKRVSLVSPGAWADEETGAAIRGAIALGRIDYYVLKPAGLRDEVFHEAVSSFLLDWALERRIVPHTVHIVGDAWSGRAHELREVFDRCVVPHAFHLAESDEGRRLVAEAGQRAKLPLMILPDGRILSDPSNAEIAEAAGAPTDFEERTFDLVIVGAGPAGLSAAVYGASEGLQVLVVDTGGIGGQARSSSLIRNYLGFAKGVSGSRLAEQAYAQAAGFGASFVFMHRASALTRAGDRLDLSLSDGRSVGARAAILATGASYSRLGIPSLEALSGAGVFYGGPASEAPALRGSEVYIAGGANSAGQAALHLARYARRVTLLVRAGSLEAGMSHYLVRAVRAAPNVEVRTGTTVVGGGGDGHLQELVLRDGHTGEESTVAADALFVLIGAYPLTEWLPEEIVRDGQGFLLTGDDVTSSWPLERRPFPLETSMPAVFAAGDVRHSSVKRVAVAVGEGSIAVQGVQRLLASEQPDAGGSGRGGGGAVRRRRADRANAQPRTPEPLGVER
jgi:thioredoxin reductase (NADPH)